MDVTSPTAARSSWPASATPRHAAWRGARETPFLPAIILFFTFIGFGALTSEVGLSWLDAIFMSVFIFALPAQVALVDQMARGASMLTAALAVTGTAVRLLPMTVALLPTIRDPRVPKWMEFAVAYFVAVTLWVESMRRTPGVPRHLRAAYILGITAWLVSFSTTGGLIGYALAANVPAIVTGGLLFMTPMYFIMSMLRTARSIASYLPILLGLALGPIFHLLWPSLDLLLTGLIGGTISFLITRYGMKKAGGP